MSKIIAVVRRANGKESQHAISGSQPPPYFRVIESEQGYMGSFINNNSTVPPNPTYKTIDIPLGKMVHDPHTDRTLAYYIEALLPNAFEKAMLSGLGQQAWQQYAEMQQYALQEAMTTQTIAADWLKKLDPPPKPSPPPPPAEKPSAIPEPVEPKKRLMKKED